MVPDVTAPVERFHSVLVDEIRRQRPHYLRQSFPLSEIYQRLVPYRSHRDALGLDMNGDYEDVLLRLLAGAGDLVILESAEAREQIRRELDSKNPNTGLFREFATAEVHLNVQSLSAADVDVVVDFEVPVEALRPAQATGMESVETLLAEADGPELVPTDPVGDARELEATAELVPTPQGGNNGTYFDFETTALDTVDADSSTLKSGPLAATAGAPEGSALEAADKKSIQPSPFPGIWKPGHPTKETVKKMIQDDCGWCGDPLPGRPDVNFCPFCGKTTKLKPCSECGDEMELQWSFCVRCGTEASLGATAAAK